MVSAPTPPSHKYTSPLTRPIMHNQGKKGRTHQSLPPSLPPCLSASSAYQLAACLPAWLHARTLVRVYIQHRGLQSTPSMHHQGLQSKPSIYHQGLKSTPSLHHQGLQSTPFIHHQGLNFKEHKLRQSSNPDPQP